MALEGGEGPSPAAASPLPPGSSPHSNAESSICDDSSGLEEYAEVVVDAIGDRSELVLVAQSMGEFTAPLVCARVPVRLMVLVAAMVPRPGESPGEWWDDTGSEQARRQAAAAGGRGDGDVNDIETLFLHDVPPDVAAQGVAHVGP